jgi:murein DD-endopeptidase MepM/ murein hydrolase activator NlpD
VDVVARIALLLSLFAAVAPAAPDTPRADANVINLVNKKAAFDAMRAKVEPVVVELAKARDETTRKAVEDRLVAEHGRPAIEVLVRYREPHLIPVFARLTESEDWSVRRLAVFGLQRNLALSRIDAVTARLADENVLVREVAATTIGIFHVAARKHRKLLPRTRAESKASKALGLRKKKDLETLRQAREKEKDPFVAASLTASIEVMGKRPLLLIHTEQVVGEAPARRVPRLVGGEVNRYQKGSGYSGSGGGRLRPTEAWGYPTLLYPREILTITSDPPLVPLKQKANSLHFGHDCAWFLEGSSVHAVADGVVRMIRSGGDWGGLIVVEHMGKDGKKVNALNGHCGMWVFVKPGEKVKKGQVLGQIALSFSPENGGHGAHDHFGMFEGPFDAAKCYGRSRAGRSTEGWLIPPDFLTPLVEGKKVPPASYR